MTEQDDRKLEIELLEKALLKYANIEDFEEMSCQFCTKYGVCANCIAPEYLCGTKPNYYEHISYIFKLYMKDSKYMNLFAYVLKNMYWQIYTLLQKKYQVWKELYPGVKT